MRSDAWKVVVIDDSPEDRAEVRRLLLKGSDRRYQFTEAETGSTGIRAVLDASSDCVVLDYNLPDMDALEVLAALVGPDGATTCPVVVLTGSENSEFGRAVLRAGAQDFIGKGWMTAESLTRAVENAAERWAMVRELQARTMALHASESQLKQALVEIGNERELLSTTLESIGDGLITTDVKGRVTNLNPVAEALTGWTTLEAQGQPLITVFQIINEATRQPVLNPVFKSLEEGVIVGLANHTLLIHKDGTERPIDDSAAPIRGADLVIKGCVLVFRDITERKQAEAQLREREHFLHRLTDVSPSISVVFDIEEQRSVFISRPVALVLGYSADEITEMGANVVPTLMHPDDLARFPAHLDRVRALRDDETADFEHRMRDRAGEWHWFHTRDAVFARDAAGAVCQLIGASIEVTAMEQAEEALRESQQFTRRVLDNLFAFVGVLTVDGTLIEVNRAPLEAADISASEVLAKKFWDCSWWS